MPTSSNNHNLPTLILRFVGVVVVALGVLSALYAGLVWLHIIPMPDAAGIAGAPAPPDTGDSAVSSAAPASADSGAPNFTAATQATPDPPAPGGAPAGSEDTPMPLEPTAPAVAPAPTPMPSDGSASTRAPKLTTVPTSIGLPASPTPVASNVPTAVNGITITRFLSLTQKVQLTVRDIYSHGQKLGNNPAAFTAIGDSSIAGGQFMERFGQGRFNLGDFAYLQPTMNVFTSSFKRTSTAVRIGLHSWSVMNPVWADKKLCNANETVIACEFRLQKPSFVFIHLGANDDAAKLFDKSMRTIVQYAIDAGVVPILITRPAQPGATTGNTGNNEVVRKIAQDLNVPLLDFALVAATLPSAGVGEDGVHMTGYQKVDYTLPSVWKSGHALHNLSALIALDATYHAATLDPSSSQRP